MMPFKTTFSPSTANKNDFGVDAKLFLNSGVISAIIGLIIFRYSIVLPTYISSTLSILGEATTPLSMIVIGAMLEGFSLKELFANYKLYIISAFRLLIIPLALLFSLKYFDFNKTMVGVAVLITAMPAAANTTILAKQYNDNSSGVAAQGVFISTLLSIFTIPFIAYFLF